MKITYYRLQLRTLSPVAVTAPETLQFADTIAERSGRGSDKDIDLPVYRDHQGRPSIPATTLAGSLRAALPEDLRDVLMGTVQGSRSVPSAIHVLGGEVTPAGSADTQIFRRTSIDRVRGGARNHTLHDGEALPTGATITVRLAVHDAGENLLAVEGALRSWEPRLGRGISSGAGVTELVELRKAELDLSRAEDLLRYVNGGGPELVDSLVSKGSAMPILPPERRFLVDETFSIVDGLHIGSGEANGNLLLALRDASGGFILPGSSLKGVLRSRVEYILRSIGVEACLIGDCGTCPACTLFGYSLSAARDDGHLGMRSAIAVHDSAIQSPTTSERPHVAIDRVSGGALDQALFSVELVDTGRFSIRVEDLGDAPAWAAGLLLAALADIDDGYVGIGGGVTRGQGTVKSVAGRIGSRHGEAIASAIATIRAEQKELSA